MSQPISTSAGFGLAEGLDVIAFDKVNQEAARLSDPNNSARPSKKNAFVAFAHAWQGVAIRYAAALEDNQDFIHTFGGENTFDVLAQRQKYLFRCVTSMVSVTDCLYFAVYCISTEVAGAPQTLNTATDLKKYPVNVAKMFSAWLPTDPLSLLLATNVDAPMYLKLRDLRDSLSHRGTVQELIQLSTSEVGHHRQVPVNPKALSKDLAYTEEYSPRLTEQHIDWMKVTVPDVIAELANFLSKQQPK